MNSKGVAGGRLFGKLFLVFVTQSLVFNECGEANPENERKTERLGKKEGREKSRESFLGKRDPNLEIFQEGSEKRGSKSSELLSARKLFRYGPCSLPSLFCFWISIRFYFGVWMRALEILLCSYGI